MKNELGFKVLKEYLLFTSLKDVYRTGWLEWNVQRKDIEKIPDHIYGTAVLAMLMYSEFDIDIDIFKVICMIFLHETEEIGIGDITPFNGITLEEKRARGKKVVNGSCGNLKKGQMFIDLIEEFEEGKTKEARFAKVADKVEAMLQSKFYTDEGSLKYENGNEKMRQDERVKKLYAQGNTTVAQLFEVFHRYVYEGTDFEEVVEASKKYDLFALRDMLLRDIRETGKWTKPKTMIKF